MTAASEIAMRIYREMGLSTPEVIDYPSVTQAIERFAEWKPRIRKFSAVLWDYQYPVLNPAGYWAQFHLFDEGFQFDLTRTANAGGCYCYPKYLSKIPIEPKLLYGRFLSAAIEAARNTEPNEFDSAISQLMDSHEMFFDALMDMQHGEDPTSQAPIESRVFLAPQAWSLTCLGVCVLGFRIRSVTNTTRTLNFSSTTMAF
ncbi:MAG: hypothetical protein KDN22_33355 [Verrucomicrobiae bacterium]|nr:hypothetical protein [Verrucomicrobiae bacterium]